MNLEEWNRTAGWRHCVSETLGPKPKATKDTLPKHKQLFDQKHKQVNGEFLSPTCICKMSETFVNCFGQLVGYCAKTKNISMTSNDFWNSHFPNWGVNSPSHSEADILKCRGVGAWLCSCCHDVRSGMMWSWLPNNANTYCWWEWGLRHQQEPNNRQRACALSKNQQVE